MENKTLKTLAISALVIAVGGLTLGYAALTQTLNISGSATVSSSSNSWIVKFNEAKKEGVPSGNAVAGNVSVTSTDVTISGARLVAPKDKIIYTLEVVNEGEIDATLATATVKTPAGEEWKQYVDITYTVDGKSVDAAEGTELAKQTGKHAVVITLTYKDVPTAPADAINLDGFGLTLLYNQK